jgi:hypothetical protein
VGGGEVRWSFLAAYDEVTLKNPNPSGLFLASQDEKPGSAAPDNDRAKTAAKIRQDCR